MRKLYRQEIEAKDVEFVISIAFTKSVIMNQGKDFVEIFPYATQPMPQNQRV